MDRNQFRTSALYIAIVLLILFSVRAFVGFNSTTMLAYSEFKALLKAGKLDELTLDDERISGSIKTGDVDGFLTSDALDSLKKQKAGKRHFVSLRMDDPTLVPEMEAAGIRFSAQRSSAWLSEVLSWIVPMLIFFAIWSFAMKRIGGGGSGVFEVGKSKARVYMEKETGATFSDVAGIDEAKEELIEIVQFLKDPTRYRRLGGKIPKGVLIVGAPGTGKTLLAKAVAGEAGVPFFSISGSEFVEMFVGVGAARVRDLFAQAEQRAPCIIFIDELDALGKARGLSSFGHDEREQTLNQLLVEMDGFDTNSGVIIMAATNRPEILDPALLRPGRFDRHIALDRPDLKGRRQILDVHTQKITLAPGVDLNVIAAKTAGFAGADLANLVNEAALLAARENKNGVEMSDFDRALERIVGGLEKKNRVMNAQEKETVAYHEAGHALVAEFRHYVDRVSKISIIPRGVAALGYTQQTPTEDRYLLRKSELLDRLDVLLGGRTAEEIVFGDVSTGAQNDLQRATEMARQMVTQYGMSEVLGLATFGRAPQSMFLNEMQTPATKDYSERTASTIDAEVKNLLEQAHERVMRTLLEHRATLNALAHHLLEQEVVDRAGLDALLRESEPKAAPPAQSRHAVTGH